MVSGIILDRKIELNTEGKVRVQGQQRGVEWQRRAQHGGETAESPKKDETPDPPHTAVGRSLPPPRSGQQPGQLAGGQGAEIMRVVSV